MPPEILRRFVVLEGVDGAGTTTQLGRIGAALEARSIAHWTTAEPTGGPIGTLIRRMLGGEIRAHPDTIARLFAADRGEHVRGAGGIIERINRGEAVICDRYILSSLAYQGVSCGMDLPLELNMRFPLPELIVFFDIDPAVSMSRLEKRDKLEIYENLPFQGRVRHAYEQALEICSGKTTIVRVDARLPVQELSRLVLKAVGEMLCLDLVEAT